MKKEEKGRKKGKRVKKKKKRKGKEMIGMDSKGKEMIILESLRFGRKEKVREGKTRNG